MDWQRILQLAKQGHAQAIAALINQALPWEQTRTWGVKTDNKKLYLRSQQPLPQTEVLKFIKWEIDKLSSKDITKIQIFNRESTNNNLF